MPTLRIAVAFVAFAGHAAGADRPTPAVRDAAVRDLAARIDRHLDADWVARGVKPAARADDAEFLRRVYLDLIGRIPRVAEARAFLDDPAPDKRERLVAKLLATPGYATHFASLVRADWMPQSMTDFRTAFGGGRFEEWMRGQLAKNTPFDELVRKVLGADLPPAAVRNLRRFNDDGGDPEKFALTAFYEANEGKPEQLAASVSRLFVGVKLECAQCHDHPFAPYTRRQFWEFAAFFGEFAPLPPVAPSFVGPVPPQYDKNRITIPNTETEIEAAFFDGTDPKWVSARTPRQELADWLTAADNPYFAKNAANRLWAHFFGRGITDPVDEPGDDNPPSHPELLDDLANALTGSGFDTQVLIEAITRSRAYNLTSRTSHPTQTDPKRFAKMSLKGLNGNQIFDSFAAATGYRGQTNRTADFFDFRESTPRGRFQAQFPQPGKPTEAQTSILQALLLMNGGEVNDQTNLDKGETLAAVADAPFLNTDGKIETLFLAAYTRPPTADERERFGSYIDRGGPSGDKKKALADVFWVLLNGTEFLFNH